MANRADGGSDSRGDGYLGVVAHRRRRWIAAGLLVALGACVSSDVPQLDQSPGSDEYLYVWTTDSDSVDLNFMVVLDADPDSEGYGQVVSTLAVPTEGVTRGHHTEHTMPAGNVPLFANDFGTGETYLIDLSDPAAPALATSFTEAGPLAAPHSF